VCILGSVSRRSMHLSANTGQTATGLESIFDYESCELVSLTKVFRIQMRIPLMYSWKRILDRYQCDRKKYSDDIARWSAAFSDLYSRLNEQQINANHGRTHPLRQSKSMEMGVGSAMEDGMCFTDKYFSTSARSSPSPKKSYE